VTELEILNGFLLHPSFPEGHCLFYFRDPAFIDTVAPAERNKYFLKKSSPLLLFSFLFCFFSFLSFIFYVFVFVFVFCFVLLCYVFVMSCNVFLIILKVEGCCTVCSQQNQRAEAVDKRKSSQRIVHCG
jgi:hypothetical protein